MANLFTIHFWFCQITIAIVFRNMVSPILTKSSKGTSIRCMMVNNNLCKKWKGLRKVILKAVENESLLMNGLDNLVYCIAVLILFKRLIYYGLQPQSWAKSQDNKNNQTKNCGTPEAILSHISCWVHPTTMLEGRTSSSRPSRKQDNTYDRVTMLKNYC